MVLMLDREGTPLMPCAERKARLLLSQGRAVIHRLRPMVIRMVDALREDVTLQPVVIKLDPGSANTGIALVREELSPEGPIHHTLLLIRLEHRGEEVHSRMLERKGYRRRRRTGNCRYRAPRFDNQRRTDGQLPPSLQSRVDNVLSWVRRLIAWAPVSRVDMELAKFDTQKMRNPEISGAEYQRGELAGYDVREYLLEKWGRRCAYCKAEGVPLEIDHIVLT